VFIALSATVILLLGLTHLLYTFRGPMLHPRDPDLSTRMTTVSPVISRETTMWRVWVGLNATHSFGLILFGALYGYLAVRHSGLLFHSWFLPALGFALLLRYAVIARFYFLPRRFAESCWRRSSTFLESSSTWHSPSRDTPCFLEHGTP
jgi:hypothetical protein